MYPVSRRILVLFLLCTVSLRLSAQAMQFLLINPDPEASAMAGIDGELASDALSDKTLDVDLVYGVWQPAELRTGVAAASVFFKASERLSFGALFNRFAEPSAAGFSPVEMVAGLGASFRISDMFSAGLEAKYAHSALAETAKAGVFCADVSFACRAGSFSAIAAVRNIGGSVSYGGDSSYALPTVIKGGASYSASGFTGSAEVGYVLDAGLMAAVGAEYCIADIVSLRAGYHYGDGVRTIPSHVSVGLGVKFFGVGINASYLLASETLGGTMMFGLGYCF